MICPICKTNNTLSATNPNAEFCVQCGSDIHMHRLLHKVQQDLKMKDDITQPSPLPPKKTSGLLFSLDSTSSIVLVIVTVFVLVSGLHFLAFFTHRDSQPLSRQWSETGFAQLQEMNHTIKEELDLIVLQHQENQALRAKLQVPLNKTAPVSSGNTP